MNGQDPVPPAEPQPQDPAPQASADPTTDPQPQPQDPAPQPEPKGAKGTPDEDQKIKRMISETVTKVLEGLVPAQPQDPAPQPDLMPDVDAIKAEHAEAAKAWAIERELLKAGCVDADAAMVHIDASSVSLSDDGKTVVDGLDLDEVKKAYPYLFHSQQQLKQTVSTGAAPGGALGNGEAKNIAEALSMMKADNNN